MAEINHADNARQALGAIHTAGRVVLSAFGAGALGEQIEELEARQGWLPEWAMTPERRKRMQEQRAAAVRSAQTTAAAESEEARRQARALPWGAEEQDAAEDLGLVAAAAGVPDNGREEAWARLETGGAELWRRVLRALLGNPQTIGRRRIDQAAARRAAHAAVAWGYAVRGGKAIPATHEIAAAWLEAEGVRRGLLTERPAGAAPTTAAGSYHGW